MDKYEYKVRADEINRLIAERDFAQAAEIADAIDWRRVKSVMMLCTVSDLYKINRRYDDAKNMLLLAYERRPGGRTICYSLCELCIKTEDFVQAVNFYKEFVQAAPRDPGRYVLQYKIYEAQDVSLEERIGVLEELKKREYREKWAYELAYLYHRVGLATRCVEECDELILWFGEGKYVVKAMELKMLHQPLTPAQQEAYDHRFDHYEQNQTVEEASESEEQEASGQEGQEGEYSGLPEEQGDLYAQQDEWNSHYGQEDMAGETEAGAGEELDIQVKTMDVGKFNTINLQEELAAGLQEVLGTEEITNSIVAPMLESGEEEKGAADAALEQKEDTLQEAGTEEEEVEVFFGETGEIKDVPEDMVQEMASKNDARSEDGQEESGPDMEEEPERSVPDTGAGDETGALVMEQMRREAAGESGEDIVAVQPPRELAGVLSQESDGQIRLVVPESAAVEKQITGQMRIEDILAEWERMKKENQERCREGVRQHVLQQTGPMFTEFDAAIRDGLLEQLETEGGDEAEQESFMEAMGDFADGKTGIDGADEIEELEVLEAEEFSDIPEAGEDFAPEQGGEADGGGDLQEAEETAVYSGDYGQAELFDEYLQEASEPEDSFGDSGGAVDPDELFEEDSEPEDYADEADEPDEYLEEDSEPEDYADEPDEYLEEDSEPEYYADEADEPDEYLEEDSEPEDYADEPDEPDEYLEEDSEPEDYADEPDDFDEYLEGEEGDSHQYLEEDSESEDDSDESDDSRQYLEEASESEEDSADSGMTGSLDKLPEEDSGSAGDSDQTETSGEIPEHKPEGRTGRIKGGARKRDMTERQKGVTERQKGVAEGQKSMDERPPIERDKAKVRALTREEKELYAPFIQSRRSREQLVKAIDNVSMAAYTGNIVITGEEGMDTLTLAKNMIREIKMADSNFAGKVAKISGRDLNDRNVKKTLEEMNSGALIIYKASGMNSETARELYRSLQQERLGIVVVLEDTKKAIQKLFSANQELSGAFTARVDMEALSNDMLVLFGKRYAREMEYSIDELGVLALHTRIEELQTIDHVVTVVDVKRIVDEAIRHASRKTLGHFFDILLAKRYDDEDMVVLTEKDFVA